MTKALPPAVNPGSVFPWGLLAQAILLIVSIIESVVEEKKK